MLSWPESLPVAQVRIARPTDRLDEVVRFYVDGLGLRELHRFENHAGYDGVMVGLPGTDYHVGSGCWLVGCSLGQRHLDGSGCAVR
ncbi:hypothetical protein ACTWPB_10055 [Nocardia sp. IBHARD005]|uniref:hypothetical protein n=1 Tax=Nocardia sp. IBHARD005 TaxID=3457765 RepID=UPI004057DB69